MSWEVDGDRLFDLLAREGLDPEWMEEETEIAIACPLCEDDRPRLYIGSDTGAWICFHCDEQGGFMQLLGHVVSLDTHQQMEARRRIVDEAVDDPWAAQTAEPKREAPNGDARLAAACELPSEFKPFSAGVAPEVFNRYLLYRRINLALASVRGLGYAVGGRYARRLVVPVANDGFLFTFVARSVLAGCPNCEEPFEDCTCERRFPKVLTPSGGKPKLSLYNLDFVRVSQSERVVVVEGVFDALSLPAEGLALLGSSLSPTQLLLLAGVSRGRQVYVALDGDKAGRAGARRVADALISALVPCFIASLPDGADPNSLERDQLEDCLTKAKRYVL